MKALDNDAAASGDSACEPLTGLFPEEIAERFQWPLMRGRQIFSWLHQKRVFEAERMTNVPRALLPALSTGPTLLSTSLLERRVSEKTGTMKLLFALADGEQVEAVLLRQGGHATFCLSSQAGCALGCSFCATGQTGFRRNLQAGEIVEQALHLAREASLPPQETPNIVYMGMGEPFQNYDAVVKSIRLLRHPLGMHIGARKITVSTVGILEGVKRFAEEEWQVRLSVSLHAADDDLRSALVPVNRRHSLARLYEALRAYQRRTGRQITIEWTLLEGVNDGDADAENLARYLRGLDATVNVIPWNVVPGLPYQAPSMARSSRFLELLERKGVNATLRRERGEDIDAACGQLRAARLIHPSE